MKNTGKTIIFIACVSLVGALAFFSSGSKKQIVLPPVTPLASPETSPEPVPEPPKIKTGYHTMILGETKLAAQLTEAVGKENLSAVLSLNRIDVRHLQKNQVIVVPDSFENVNLSSFPQEIAELVDIPKMMFIAQREQEFGAYEYGKLVRFGGISTGKKATPTTSKLYFTNWKGKEVISSSNDEWILKWNFNIENHEGVGIHEYELPGYPASHSCVRFSAADAEWFYNWAEQWILSPDDKLLASGTPVLVFGQYEFGKTAPWKNLPTDKNATTISLESLQEKLKPLLEEIHTKQENRNALMQQA